MKPAVFTCTTIRRVSLPPAGAQQNYHHSELLRNIPTPRLPPLALVGKLKVQRDESLSSQFSVEIQLTGLPGADVGILDLVGLLLTSL